MITKFKQFFTRTLGITLTTILIASGLTALAPTAAYADEDEDFLWIAPNQAI